MKWYCRAGPCVVVIGSYVAVGSQMPHRRFTRCRTRATAALASIAKQSPPLDLTLLSNLQEQRSMGAVAGRARIAILYGSPLTYTDFRWRAVTFTGAH
jgi:hypothetical protein